MAQENEFRIYFEGSSVINSEISVSELAPALLALNELINEASHAIDPHSNTTYNLNVKAFSKGSFIIDLSVNDVLKSIIEFFSSKDGQFIISLLGLLGINAKDGLLALIKFGKNQKPKTTIEIDNGSKVRLEFDDGRVIEVKNGADRLYQNIAVRKAAEKVFKPLENKGIDEIKIIGKEEIIFEAKKEDLPAFQVSTKSEEIIISDKIEVKYLSIVSLAFKDDNKWRLTDGSSTFSVSIHDEAFVNRIKSNREIFSMGTILKVQMRIIVYNTTEGIKTDYQVLKVEENIPPAQLTLDFK
ncbi:MAG: hypothetical protein SFU91_07895 [Chloroherpetonaceae bacterium]|nr:hypothetical protein [Chloroherpetonaceae bacterium]